MKKVALVTLLLFLSYFKGFADPWDISFFKVCWVWADGRAEKSEIFFNY